MLGSSYLYSGLSRPKTIDSSTTEMEMSSSDEVKYGGWFFGEDVKLKLRVFTDSTCPLVVIVLTSRLNETYSDSKDSSTISRLDSSM